MMVQSFGRMQTGAMQPVRELTDVEVLMFNRKVERSLQRWMAKKQVDFPKLFIPGSLYHMVAPVGRTRIQRWFHNQPTLVYPVKRESFGEIIVSSLMWLDHFPNVYLKRLRHLDVPLELLPDGSEENDVTVGESNEPQKKLK